MAQLSRKHEFQADAFAVAQTSAHDLRTALLKLYEDNASTLTPDPVFVKFYYSHPPATERLARMGRGMTSMLAVKDWSGVPRRALKPTEVVTRLAPCPAGSWPATAPTSPSRRRSPSPTTTRPSPS
jgi:hypothetical protein